MLESDYTVATLAVAALISGVIGAAVAQAKRASTWQGFCWGFVLGPIGWLIAAIALQALPPKPDRAAEVAAKMARARALAAANAAAPKAE